MVEARRDTIGELPCGATDTEVVVPTIGQLVDLTLPVGIGRAKIADGRGRDALDEGTVFVSREDVDVASGLREGVLYRYSYLSLLSDLTTLGSDHDDPVGGTRAIDSGSRGILQDVHRGDVLGVEGAQDARSTRDRTILDGHSIDDDEWVVARIERSTPTDADTTTSTGGAVRGDLYPSDLPDEEVTSGGDSPLLEVLLVDRADRPCEVLLLHGAVADDDDLLE